MKYFLFALSVFIAFVFNHAVSQESREIAKELDLSQDGSVSIDTYKGSITIETWDKSKIDIKATIEADGGGRDQEEKVRDTDIRIQGTSNHVEIKSDYSHLDRHGFSLFGLFSENDPGTLPFVHYKILMPSTAKLKIKDYKSDTKITNLKSSVKMETYKGIVDMMGIDGSVNLETYKGEVRVEYTKYSGTNRYETYKGKITLVMPHDTGFYLDADLGRRADLNSDFDMSIKHRSRDNDYLRGSINGGGPTLEISSEKGDIQLKAK